MQHQSKYKRKRLDKRYHLKDRVARDKRREENEQHAPKAPTKAELLSAMSYSHTTLGGVGELLIKEALERSGYYATIHHTGHDITAVSRATGEIFYLEIKTARARYDKTYNFTLSKAHHTDHRKADFVILLCINKAGLAIPFVIPIAAIRNQQTAQLYPTFKGKFAPYRQSLDHLTLETLQ